MINSDTASTTYTAVSGQTEYPIGFQYYFNSDDTPQIMVVFGKPTDDPLVYGEDYTISDDKLNVVFTEEPEVGTKINITRNVPFTQTSDYVIGRIDPDQIERDFDLAVMRAQQSETAARNSLSLAGGAMYGGITWEKGDLSVGGINAYGNTEEQKAIGIFLFDENHDRHPIVGVFQSGLIPGEGTYNLGSSAARWSQIWASVVYATDIQVSRLHSGGSNTILLPNASGTMVVAQAPNSHDDGTYVLKAVVSDNTITYQWVKE